MGGKRVFEGQMGAKGGQVGGKWGASGDQKVLKWCPVVPNGDPMVTQWCPMVTKW